MYWKRNYLKNGVIIKEQEKWWGKLEYLSGAAARTGSFKGKRQ